MPSRAASSGSDTISSATPSTASTSSRVSSDSTTSWRVMYVEMVAWMIAAAGNAARRPEQARDRAAGQRREERHRRVQRHGSRRDAGRQQVVLDLLVHDDVDREEQGRPRMLEQRDEQWDRGRDVRADHRDELEMNPRNSASGIANGTPRIDRTKKATRDEIAASSSREYR